MTEFAIAITAFFMLLLGIVLWGMTIWQVNTLHFAVERGARCAILTSCPDLPETFSAKEALGLSASSTGGGAEKYLLQSGKNLPGATTFYTACIRTIDKNETNAQSGKSAVDSIAGSVPLIQSFAKLSTVRYCRPVQG